LGLFCFKTPASACVSANLDRAIPTGDYAAQANAMSAPSSQVLRCGAQGWARRFITVVTLILLASCDPAPVQPVPKGRTSTPQVAAAELFPLKRTDAHRCLTTPKGSPFLIHGDAAWSLIVQLNRAETIRYLDDRKARGFNALLVNAIEHEVARAAPRNAFGDLPFEKTGDFSTPNEKYFAHVDWVLERAAERGFLVLLAPAYLGYEGGNEGWYAKVRKAGPERMRMYGRYLGMRYRGARNVVWLHGGDFDPPDRVGMLALVEGLREEAPGAIHSFHGARGTSARAFFGKDVPWLDLNTVYTNEKDVVRQSFAEYSATKLPFIFIEGQYENAGADERVIRTQAIQALLSGACGQIMGNKPIWSFNAEWERALDSPGAQSMSRLRSLLESNRWHDWRPATAEVILAGAGSGSEAAVAAIARNGRRVVAYFPSAREAELELTRHLAGPIDIKLIDPASGEPANAFNANVSANGRLVLKGLPQNSRGFSDWLLIAESR
jgi:hypothetical protein